MVKNRVYLFLSLILIIFGTSCTQKKPAQILLKGHLKYDKNSGNHRKYAATEVPKKVNVKIAPGQNFITVKSGDNLYKIAQENSSSVRDLIDVNNLQPPYFLRVGDRLIIADTKYYTVQQGDNLYKVSRAYNMNINDLIKLNNLEEPYNIVVGSKLKITPAYIGKAQTNEVMVAKKKIPSIIDIKLPDKENKFSWPINGKVISTFGQKPGGLYNDGINIKANESDPVKATEDGLVAYVGNELRGYGNLVIIKHSGGWISAYAHLKDTKVKIGGKVSKGEQIATVGSSGNVTSPQLYFGIRKGRDAVNPQIYLD